MPALFNQTFYDLNGKRAYALHPTAVPEWFPADVIADMKVSLPSFQEQLFLGSLFLQGNTVRMTFLVNRSGSYRLAATFSSDQREMLRIGTVYPLVSVLPEYGGWVVFGPNVKKDFTEKHEPLLLSEECCTRYVPSAIHYAAKTCDTARLTGEVGLSSGDPAIFSSSCVEVTEEDNNLQGRALRLGLKDTGAPDKTNPMIGMANGSNNYSGMAEGDIPIFKMFGVTPDSDGRLTWVFDTPFYFMPVLSEANILTVGSDFDLQDVCDQINGSRGSSGEEQPLEECSLSDIEFQEIDYR